MDAICAHEKSSERTWAQLGFREQQGSSELKEHAVFSATQWDDAVWVHALEQLRFEGGETKHSCVVTNSAHGGSQYIDVVTLTSQN
eukprot:3068599-Amphidinium_carterae.1